MPPAHAVLEGKEQEEEEEEDEGASKVSVCVGGVDRSIYI